MLDFLDKFAGKTTVDVSELLDLQPVFIEGAIKRLYDMGVRHFIFPEGTIYPLNIFLVGGRKSDSFQSEVHFVGNFELEEPLGSSKHISASYTHIIGPLNINNYNRKKEIEIPEGLRCADVFANKMSSPKYIIYGDASNYRNRPERLAILQRREEEKRKLEEINKSGVLEISDNYGVPLEIGCLVVSGCTPYIVVEQLDHTKVKLESLSNATIRTALSGEIMRII